MCHIHTIQVFVKKKSVHSWCKTAHLIQELLPVPINSWNFFFTVHYLIIIITKLFYSTFEALERTLCSLSGEKECWATAWVTASVWPGALIQNLAWNLCKNRLPNQNPLSQLGFNINYSGKVCGCPESAAKLKETPSGVISKKLDTVDYRRKLLPLQHHFLSNVTAICDFWFFLRPL